jgi:hypothetical protein
MFFYFRKNPVQEEAVGEENDTSPTLKSSPNPTGKGRSIIFH